MRIQRYVRTVPRKVPKGLAFVHNFQPTPMQALNIGLDGFRCFYVKSSDAKRFGRCNCATSNALRDQPEDSTVDANSF
jgi:hypothetical protein